MNKTVKKIAVNALYAAVLIAVVLAIWAIAASVINTEFIMPGIGSTFCALRALLKNAAFLRALCGTLLRAGISFALSVALFFGLFFLSSAFNGAKRIIGLFVALLRTLPTMAIALVLAVWMGRVYAPVVLGVAVIMPQLYSAVSAHNATVPTELYEVCRLCGAGKCRIFSSLYLPHAAAAFPEAMSSALSFDIKIIIAAEILMQTNKSIGSMMKESQRYLEMAELIAMTVAAVVVAVALECVLRLVLGRILARYRD